MIHVPYYKLVHECGTVVFVTNGHCVSSVKKGYEGISEEYDLFFQGSSSWCAYDIALVKRIMSDMVCQLMLTEERFQ